MDTPVEQYNEFSRSPGASEEKLRETERSLAFPLPEDYCRFLRFSNGGEGFVGRSYLILWAVEDLAQFNKEYQVQDYAPGLFLFGSNGGGEGFAFDTRVTPFPVVRVPFVGMDLQCAKIIAKSFKELFASLAG
jgi:hypothetical protein